MNIYIPTINIPIYLITKSFRKVKMKYIETKIVKRQAQRKTTSLSATFQF